MKRTVFPFCIDAVDTRSEELFQFLCGDFTVTDDLRQKAATDCFTGMYGYYRTPAVNMLKEMMTAFTSNDLESQFPKGLDQALARDSGEVAYNAPIATSARRTSSTPSGDSGDCGGNGAPTA